MERPYYECASVIGEQTIREDVSCTSPCYYTRNSTTVPQSIYAISNILSCRLTTDELVTLAR